MTTWRDIDPKDAVDIVLPHEGIEGPMNEMGERCAWPWDPQQLKGAPLGQYHCPYCGGMQVAGVEHLDWTDKEIGEMSGPVPTDICRDCEHTLPVSQLTHTSSGSTVCLDKRACDERLAEDG